MGISMPSSLILLVALTVGCQGKIFGGEHSACQNVPSSCQNTFKTMMPMARIDIQTPDIQEMCRLHSIIRECMGECWDAYALNSSAGRAVHGVLEYVCNESRRDRIAEILTAQCFVDGTFQINFGTMYRECTYNELSSKRDEAISNARALGERNLEAAICPLVDNVMHCIDEEIEGMCGAEVVPLVQDTFNIAFGEMWPERLPSCFERATGQHNIMKRAASFMNMITE